MLQCSETETEHATTRAGGAAGPTIRAYLRVSTRKQAEAAGVDSQRRAIERWAAGRPVEWYEDNGCSGATMERDQWQRLLADVRKGDTIAVYDLSRVSRDSLDIIAWTRQMIAQGISVAFVGQGFDLQAGPVGSLILTVWAAVVQFERDMAREKTREGMAAAQRRGARIGRGALRVEAGAVVNINTGEPSEASPDAAPKLTPELIAEAVRRKRKGEGWGQIAESMGVNPKSLWRARRRLG